MNYYINAGNITTVKTYALTSSMEKGALQSTNTYTYDATWKDKLATYSDGDTTYTFTYDEIGNPINYRNGMTMDWDRGRQLSSLTIGNKTVEYEYNADGLRTYKNDSTGYETIYYYDTSNNLIAIDQNSAVCYFYYDSNGEVTSMSFNGTLYFFVKNLQGDVEKIVDRQGIVQVSYTYDEWGNVISIDDDSYYTLSYFNPFLYRSYIYDRETGLYYLQSRYYDPQTGRFLNADDTAYLGATGTALSCNLFAYCENEPVNRSDCSGSASKPSRKEKVVSTYKKINKKGKYIFNITSNITIDKTTYVLRYKINKKAVLIFDFNKNFDYSVLFSLGSTKIVGETIFQVVKKINIKYSEKYLKGRTIEGINKELMWHYRAYYWGILTKNANPANIGSTDKNNKGYDSNAWIFEPKIDWGDKKL